MSSPRITGKRQLVQLVLIAVALLVPFASLHGKPFLRMDIAGMTLFLGGIALRIDQFYLVLITSLLGVVLFLLVTAVLGRVWCGWLCPQTVFNDVMELFNRAVGKRVPAIIARPLGHLGAVAIAAIIALDLFCWFMAPAQALQSLFDGAAHPVMIITFLILTIFGYVNLIVVKRSFCRSYCPYGRFQTALMDAGTLNLSFLEETRHHCLRCNACVRSCPMDIDIRNGFQIECISCGRCIDACRSIMERRPEKQGLIDYRFGTVKGTNFRPGTTTLALLVITVLLAVALVWGVTARNQSGFVVQRVATAEARQLPDGTVAQPWRAIIGNRSETEQSYELKLDGGNDVELLGQTRDIRIAPNQHREIIFMIHQLKGHPTAKTMTLQLFNNGTLAGSAQVVP